MDYLDTNKELRHRVILLAGYVLIGIAIVISAMVLLYQAYGFGIDKNGAVVQNGLGFLSSHPHPANIYINGKLQSVRTNSRLSIPSGVYEAKLTRTGYYDWQRKVEFNGGHVEHYDYPFLFPKELVTKKIHTYSAAPGLMTQSPDHRWLMVQEPASNRVFSIYDLKNQAKEPISITLPDNIPTKGTTESFQLAEWADDNQHVLLKHTYDDKSEYVLVDRTDASQSVNLNTSLSINPTELTLIDKKYDKYYIYDSTTTSVRKLSLKDNQSTAFQEHVLAYKSYSDDTMLYVTDNGAPSGKVYVKMNVGGKTWTIRSLAAGSTYVVDLTEYSGDLYVAAGSAADNRVYIYNDPVGQLSARDINVAVPAQVLHVEGVNYLSFSANAQFIVAENANRFGVYDIENETGYNYATTPPLDPPQVHATWMDGDRLVYASGGKLVVYDYDNTNPHTLMAASPAYLPAFDQDAKYVYGLAPDSTTGQYNLTQTALLTAADL
jgi:hypothetical protein